MKKVQLIMVMLFALVMTSISYSQITTTSVTDSKEILDETPYDSLSNFLGKDCHKYVGQEFYLLPKSESLRKYGYEGFTLDYTKSGLTNKSNVYKCCDSYNSKYEDLSGKYFEVLEIYNHPKAKESEYLYGKKKYLKLKEKESGDIVYYLYDSNYEHSFPFLVVGYCLKQKKINIGKQMIVRGDNWISRSEPMSDMKTGLPVSFDKGSKWTCIDLSVEDKYYTLSMILENEKGEQIPLSLSSFQRENFRSTWGVFDYNDVQIYIKRFGSENWTTILEGKVKVGFTEEMVKLSWGKPDKINRSSYSDQWVYDNQYLYFEGGKLKSFN